MLQLNEVMQETETDEPVKTAVIEFLDSLSLVINDQKLDPNYGVGEFLIHLLFFTRHISETYFWSTFKQSDYRRMVMQLQILWKVNQN